MKEITLLALLCLIFSCSGSQKEDGSLTAENVVEKLQEKLISAQDGDDIILPEGTFKFQSEISLDGVPNVTIKGAGKGKTILSFDGQVAGAQGLLIKAANGITLEGFTVQDTKGDAIKVLESKEVTFRDVETTWTKGALSTNGGYGLYPISCTNVLMEECEASYASDAGIYVGQSTNVIVRNNYVHHNVAGLEIENTINAEVYENRCEENTGGLLIFDMPDLPQANGNNVKVFKNRVVNNNHENFAPEGTVVATLPPGSGFTVMAHKNVEITDNIIKQHKSSAITIISWVFTGKPFESKDYDPFSSNVYVHNNSIESVTGPSDNTTDFGKILTAITEGKGADIVTDGIFNPAQMAGKGPNICLSNNGEGLSFLNVNAAQGPSVEEMMKNHSRDGSAFQCEGQSIAIKGHDSWLATADE